MKKFKVFFLLAASLLAGCDDIKEIVHSFNVSVKVPGLPGFNLRGDFVYYDEMFAIYDENEYHNNLAYLSCLNNIDTIGIDTDGLTDKKAFEQLGFDNVHTHDMDLDGFSEDPLDVCNFTVANKAFEYDDKKYQVFALNVLGTKTLDQMASNLDIGVDNETYLNREEAHLEWIHKENHKGFDVTANRILDDFYDYVAEYKKDDVTLIYYVSGHSRGGAVANIIAKELTDTKVKTFGYCGASPATTTDVNASKYTNIFCFTNTDDVVPYFPSESMGFIVYGKRVYISIEDNIDLWNEMTNFKSYKHLDVKLCQEVMRQLAISRDDLYRIPDSKDPMELMACSTYEYAEILYKDYQKKLEENPILARYVKLTDIEQLENGKYGFYLVCAPAMLLELIIRVVQEPEQAKNIIETYSSYIGRYMTIFKPLLNYILQLGTDLISYTCIPHFAANYLVALSCLD